MPVLSSISRELDEYGFWKSEKFRTEHGAEFVIEPQASGLYAIRMAGGGVQPKICEGLYTSHLRARDILIDYVKKTDKLGYAEYPTKDPALVKKAKPRGAKQGE